MADLYIGNTQIGGGVSGVKGNAETTYRDGKVNITPANLGITVVNNTADSNKSVKYATSAGSATKATQDGGGQVIAAYLGSIKVYPSNEIVTFNLKTNQSSHSDINGVTITITHDNITKTLTWYGSELTYTIPAGLLYTVSYSAVTGYTTPASLTFTAVGGNTNTVSATYNIKTYTLTVKVSGLSSGFSLAVKYGSTTKTQTTTSATYTVSHGQSWSVSGANVTDYSVSGNTSGTMTANKTITITYTKLAGTTNPSNGVYIHATNGRFYTESEWDGTYTPNGIAVITSNCRFVMALTNAYSSTCEWGSYDTEVSIVTTTTSESSAQKDYSGEWNTTTIINALNGTNDGYVDGAPAAEYCQAFTFPNGATGYMGAAGEWQAALDNKAAITSALSKCGGKAMSNWYWTSTQHNSTRSWSMCWNYEYLYHNYKYVDHYVRSFCSI